MTNSFVVAVMVLWSTNRMDTLLTPSGDDIMRNTITVRTDIYTIPGQLTQTNVVPVSTNSVRRLMRWVEMPPVPPTNSNEFHTNAPATPWDYSALSTQIPTNFPAIPPELRSLPRPP